MIEGIMVLIATNHRRVADEARLLTFNLHLFTFDLFPCVFIQPLNNVSEYGVTLRLIHDLVA